jgi:hypothetical protein
MKDLKRKMGKEIKIIKKDDPKRFDSYNTFIDDTNNNIIELRKVGVEKAVAICRHCLLTIIIIISPKEYEFKLRNNLKKNMKSRNESRLVGGHGTHSHSPVYE